MLNLLLHHVTSRLQKFNTVKYTYQVSEVFFFLFTVLPYKIVNAYVIKTLSNPKSKNLNETEVSKSGKIADFVVLLSFHAPPDIVKGKK